MRPRSAGRFLGHGQQAGFPARSTGRHTGRERRGAVESDHPRILAATVVAIRITSCLPVIRPRRRHPPLGQSRRVLLWSLLGVQGEKIAAKRIDLLQGTLDMLILKAVSLGPLHGYGVLLRIQQISGELLQIQQGSLYPALCPYAKLFRNRELGMPLTKRFSTIRHYIHKMSGNLGSMRYARRARVVVCLAFQRTAQRRHKPTRQQASRTAAHNKS